MTRLINAEGYWREKRSLRQALLLDSELTRVRFYNQQIFPISYYNTLSQYGRNVYLVNLINHIYINIMKTFKPLIYISKELITVSAEARYRSVFPPLVTIYINKFIYIIKE